MTETKLFRKGRGQKCLSDPRFCDLNTWKWGSKRCTGTVFWGIRRKFRLIKPEDTQTFEKQPDQCRAALAISTIFGHVGPTFAKNTNSPLVALQIAARSVFSYFECCCYTLSRPRPALLRGGRDVRLLVDNPSPCAWQCGRRAHRDVHRDRCHAGGAGRRGQSGRLRLHRETAPAALPHGPSRGIPLKLQHSSPLPGVHCSLQLKPFIENTALKSIKRRKKTYNVLSVLEASTF